MNDKIAIYDFCQTIVDFETADEFIHFIHRNENSTRMNKIEQLRKFMIKFKLMWALEKTISVFKKNYSVNKRMILAEIKGMEKLKIDQYALKYYEQVIKQHFISPVLENLKQQKKEGFKIYIVSASYEPFLKLFKNEYDIDYLITNNFKYTSKGRFTGKLCGRDCVGINKVNRLSDIIDIDKLNEVELKSYGDSKSDIYILKIAKCGYVVSYKYSKKWVKENNLEEIIWE